MGRGMGDKVANQVGSSKFQTKRRKPEGMEGNDDDDAVGKGS